MPSAFPAGPNSAATASWLQVLLTILGGARTVQPLELRALSEFPGRGAPSASLAVRYLGTGIRI